MMVIGDDALGDQLGQGKNRWFVSNVEPFAFRPSDTALRRNPSPPAP